jgi:hypothetical protein
LFVGSTLGCTCGLKRSQSLFGLGYKFPQYHFGIRVFGKTQRRSKSHDAPTKPRRFVFEGHLSRQS